MSKRFDIVVIGSGPGGYIAALHAGQKGAKVAVVESGLLGGTCLNVGCIPSKALLASAELIHRIEHAGDMGVTVGGEVAFDWPAIQKRKDKVVATLRNGVKSLLASRKVKVFEGRGAIAGKGRVAVALNDGATADLRAKSIILAVGSVPARIPDWPDDPVLVCTSDEALHWKELPKRLLVVGGGVIGCEFACMMSQYRVDVTVVEMLPQLLPEMEPQLGRTLEAIFAKRSIACLTGTKVAELSADGGRITATIEGGRKIVADKVLVATGRRPNTADIGLETLGIEVDRGFVGVDDAMATSAKDVYCIGDANGRCLLAHAASAQGVVAAENAMGSSRTFDRHVPNAVYTFPEIASVGLTTTQAREQGIPLSVGFFPLRNLGKAMAVGQQEGFVKVLRGREDGRLLGVHALSHNATDVITAAATLLDQKAGARDLAETVIAHPTFAEAMKESAEDSLDRALHLPPRKLVRVVAGA